VKATEVTAGLAESNGSLLPGLWRDSLDVTCGLTACTPGSAPGPTLGNEYGKTLPFYLFSVVVNLTQAVVRKNGKNQQYTGNSRSAFTETKIMLQQIRCYIPHPKHVATLLCENIW